MESYIALIKDNFINDIQIIADHLSEKGMKISRINSKIGSIEGFCLASEVSLLEKVDGVLEIVKGPTSNLPTSNTKLQ